MRSIIDWCYLQMILNDSWSRFRGHAITWRWISQKRYKTYNGKL